MVDVPPSAVRNNMCSTKPNWQSCFKHNTDATLEGGGRARTGMSKHYDAILSGNKRKENWPNNNGCHNYLVSLHTKEIWKQGKPEFQKPICWLGYLYDKTYQTKPVTFVNHLTDWSNKCYLNADCQPKFIIHTHWLSVSSSQKLVTLIENNQLINKYVDSSTKW